MSYQINCTDDGLIKYPMHKHKKYEIMLYLEGKGYMRTSMGDFPFERGTVIIVPPGILHGSVSECGFKNISVEGDFDGYLSLDTVTSISDNEANDAISLASMIYENRYGNQAYVNALCIAYVSFLAQCFEIENTVNLTVERIISEISENALDSNIRLARILNKSGYSEDYIRAAFKKKTGKTPTEFLTEIRIRHACFLIDIYKKELSLSDISERCGYLDYVYFSKKFKSITGMSPREYSNQ